MSTEDFNDEEFAAEEVDEVVEDNESSGSGKYEKIISEGDKRYKLSGLYKEWYIDYASYVILERAVPHIEDGLKPVQRRILHAMRLLDDGRLNKVASLVGATMPFHPHGDASIKDALVQLGQKELLIDCQGNWGNILTGDPAAAGRYIEARLSEFAKEVVFNEKTTEWVNSYDGRNKEPVSLPVKFPLLLAQGTEGIGVGLAVYMLPHNFNELIDASVAYLKGEEFELYPDFPTGGLLDATNYKRGIRGGKVRVRAKIEKLNKNTLVIREIPFTTNSGKIIDSIMAANDKGKIKIKKIDDNTSEFAEIIIYLHNDISPDKTIDALYACTKCEITLSPNSCVIKDKRPQFLGVDEILKYNTDATMGLLKRELEIRLAELDAEWHYTSLEKIFFENKVYKVLENNALTWEKQLKDVLAEMLTYQHLLRAPITKDDINKLVEKPVRKISRFDIKAVTDKIAKNEKNAEVVRKHLANLVQYTIDYYLNLKSKYGSNFPRRTEICTFENIEVKRVVVNNAKLYVNREEGFIGLSPKKIENAEYVCECSDIDEALVFIKDGRYIVKKLDDKLFIDKNILHVAIFSKTDDRTVYNVVYRDGKGGVSYAKRFSITGVTRDRWYNLTKGADGSSILWFTCNPNGEAECLKVFLRPRPKLKKLIKEFDFAELAIKNRNSMGNIVSKTPIQKITLKSAGVSTIGGKQMWFDTDINRLNEDGRGLPLGEFKGNEHILAICNDGTFYTANLDLSNRFQGDLKKIECFNRMKIYSAIYWDGSLNCYYIKRFVFELSDNTVQLFISDASGSRLHALNEDPYPQIQITFEENGKKTKAPELIDVEGFIGVKGIKAKGKRASSGNIKTIEFIEPLQKDAPTNSEITLDSEFDDILDTESIEENETPTTPVETKESAKETLPPGSTIELNLDDELTLF